LTGEHLIPVASDAGVFNYIPAKDVKAGHDTLYVLSIDHRLIQSLVIRVSIETKIGYFAPLTTTGRVIVISLIV
jgi:hypothetical protein